MNEDAHIDRQDTLDSLELAVATVTVATPCIGFRIWRLIDGVLCSPHRAEDWEQAVLEASCHGGEGALTVPHASPDHRCTCGIYVSDTPNVGFSQVDFRGVTGIVTVWGTLLREDDGARAQFARVAALGVYSHWTPRQKEAVRMTARRLEADTVDVMALDRVSRRYGARLPGQSTS